MSNSFFNDLSVASKRKELEMVHEQEGIGAEVSEISHNVSPISNLKSFWHSYKLCKREKPTIAHSHTPKPSISYYQKLLLKNNLRNNIKNDLIPVKESNH